MPKTTALKTISILDNSNVQFETSSNTILLSRNQTIMKKYIPDEVVSKAIDLIPNDATINQSSDLAIVIETVNPHTIPLNFLVWLSDTTYYWAKLEDYNYYSIYHAYPQPSSIDYLPASHIDAQRRYYRGREVQPEDMRVLLRSCWPQAHTVVHTHTYIQQHYDTQQQQYDTHTYTVSLPVVHSTYTTTQAGQGIHIYTVAPTTQLHSR